MRWSAGNIAIVPTGFRAPTNAAAKLTAGQVLRPQGSATTFSLGNLGSCFLTAAACVSLVIIKNHLINRDVSIFDLGPYNEQSVDYPDYAKRLANRVKFKKSEVGILVCGSGTGMAISANKISAQCYGKTSKFRRGYAHH